MQVDRYQPDGLSPSPMNRRGLSTQPETVTQYTKHENVQEVVNGSCSLYRVESLIRERQLVPK